MVPKPVLGHLKTLAIAILLSTAIVLPALRPLFYSGFFTMHDDQQVVRLYLLDQSLSAGQFPVRWVDGLGFGFGYPLFIFYPPLVYYLGEIFHLILSATFIVSIKFVFALGFIAAACTMYLWARHHFGFMAGLVASVFYTYTPYHAVDAYVRGALAELFSFVWLPLILHSVDKIFDSRAKNPPPLSWSLLLGGSFAALIITHNLIALPFALISALYALIRLAFTLKGSSFGQGITISKHLLLAAFIGLGASAFFWLPALAEKQYTIVDDILLQERYTYSLHFASPEQLWNSLWGYGGSSPDKLDGFSLKIGKPQLVISAFVFLTATFLIFGKKRRIQSPKLLFLIINGLLLIFAAFMTTNFSRLVWDSLPPLHFLQFPWRFLTFAALFSSLLAGGGIWLAGKLVPNKATTPIVAVIFITLTLIPHLKLFTPETYLEVDDSHYTDPKFVSWTTSKTSFEFVPAGVATTIELPLNITQVDIQKDQIALEPATLVGGQAHIDITHNKPHFKQLHISSDQGAAVQFNTFNFPGWQATIDGQPKFINDDNPLKLIRLSIPQGEHTVSLSFSNTKVRSLGNFITAATLITFAYLITRSIFKKSS